MITDGSSVNETIFSNAINQANRTSPINYAKPVYQMSTTNKTFLEMHYFLRSQGIKNNKFMLILYDTDLAGINPYDPALSMNIKAKIFRECECNYWYYLREVVRVTASGNPRGVPYKLNRGNMAYNFCTACNLNIFFEMPRQVGKTVAALVRNLYVYNFGTTNANILFMNKQAKDSTQNLADLKAIRDLLPSYLQFSQKFSLVNGKKKMLPSTVKTIQNPINKNVIRTSTGARNETLAGNLLRGQTITIWWADEWAFTTYNRSIYVNGIPALSRAFDNAKKAHVPYGITITTTAGRMNTDEGIFAHKMIEEATPFNEHWYDLSLADIQNLIASNTNSNFVYVRYTYKQLGLSEEWFYNLCKDMGWDMLAIRREVLLEWIDTPANSPFSMDDLNTLHGLVHEPIRTMMILNKYDFRIYDTVPVTLSGIPINPPIIGVDVSGGYKRDYDAISIIDSDTTKYIGGIKCNYMRIPDLARVLIFIVKNMMPNAVVNIERNGGFGASLISLLKEPGGIKENLYYEFKDRVIEETSDEIGRPVRRKQRTKVYGLDSSKDMRKELIDILLERMDRHKDKFNSVMLYDELTKMEVKRSGKIEHSDNSHDDLVFSYLMAMYVWYDGKQLKENFGINKSSIRTEKNVDDIVGEDVEKKYTEIVEELVLPTEEQTKAKEELNKQMKWLNDGMGILFTDFVKRERAKDDEFLKELLKNKEIRKSYAKFINLPEVDVEKLSNSSKYTIPSEVFTDFNNASYNDRIQKEINKNMNFSDFDPGR